VTCGWICPMKKMSSYNASLDIFCELCLVCFQIVKIWDIQIWDVGPPFKKYLIIFKQNDHHLSRYCDLCITFFFSKNAKSFTFTKYWYQLWILFHKFTNRQNETHLMNACPTPLVRKILQIKLTLGLLGKKCVGRNWHENTL
jgi:hypothetical protein